MYLSIIELAILWIYLIVYSLISGYAIFSSCRTEDGRKKSLFLLFLANLAVSYLGIASSYFWINIDSSNLGNFFSFLGLFTVGVFVLTIEVPGFILLSRYDEKTVDILKEVHENLISSVFTFTEAIGKLSEIDRNNKQRLEEVHLQKNLNYFVKTSKDMRNIDSSLHNLLLTEVSQQIHQISDQSKHPFPKLIDVLSLTGLSFLIAQFLK